MAVLHKLAVNLIRGTLIGAGIAFLGLAAVSILWLWGFSFVEAWRNIFIVGYQSEIYTGIGSMYMLLFYSIGPVVTALTGLALFSSAAGHANDTDKTQ